jgi:hypothetical protein
MARKTISLTCCLKCGGEGKIWDFADPEEPNFYYCELCKGVACTVNN